MAKSGQSTPGAAELRTPQSHLRLSLRRPGVYAPPDYVLGSDTTAARDSS